MQAESLVRQQLFFIIDIDGTLILSKKQIPGSSQSLNLLNELNYPYVLLTNNISKCQQTMAEYVNTTLLNLNKKIQRHNVILNYTPTKNMPQIDWENINVLLIGRQHRFRQILPLEHISRYVTIQQYVTMFPQLVPLSRRHQDENSRQTKQQVKQRLDFSYANRQNTQFNKQNIKFGAILILTCPLHWEQCYQIVIDLLNSQDGSFNTQQTQYKYKQNHIPVITLYNDMYYKSNQCNLPRLLIRQFNQGLKQVYQAVYQGHSLNLLTYGKPQSSTFLYTQKHCHQYFVTQDNPNNINKKFVMIGDNLESDIIGAKNCGWDTIFVQTGVDKTNQPVATITANNIYQGLIQYFQFKGISLPKQLSLNVK